MLSLSNIDYSSLTKYSICPWFFNLYTGRVSFDTFQSPTNNVSSIHILNIGKFSTSNLMIFSLSEDVLFCKCHYRFSKGSVQCTMYVCFVPTIVWHIYYWFKYQLLQYYLQEFYSISKLHVPQYCLVGKHLWDHFAFPVKRWLISWSSSVILFSLNRSARYAISEFLL